MSILIISLICISSVAGSDLITENENSDFLETSDGNSLISVGTCENDYLKSGFISDEKQDVNGNESEFNSFKDLDSQIHSSLNEVNLTQNYLFDDEVDSDFVSGIKITNNDLVIDGLNHVIDANGKARIFNISSNNVTLKTLNSSMLSLIGEVPFTLGGKMLKSSTVLLSMTLRTLKRVQYI